MNSKMAVKPNTNSLKEALSYQQRLLQTLYTELDVERESAATAASEALSMILRLQGEKAAVTMEAEQYKRLAEEKINHAEEAMQIYEEIMFQKENEVASLDSQVQAYRYKLLSLGFNDLGPTEMKFPEKLLQRTQSLGESSRSTPKRLKFSNLKKSPLERDRSIAADPDTIARIIKMEESTRGDGNCDNQNSDLGLGLGLGFKRENSSSVDINSYLEQIRKLDKVVEDMVGEEDFSSSTAVPSRSFTVPSKLNQMNVIKSSQKSIDEKVSSNACSPSVHDVFEVSVIDETETLYKDEGKSVIRHYERDEKLKKLDNFPQSPKKPFFSEHKDKKVNVDCGGLAAVEPAMTSSAEVGATCREMNARGGESESVVQNVGRETVNTVEEQELRLLHDINEKLDSIQSEIKRKNLRMNESTPNLDVSLLQLREALFDFWI